MKEEDFFTEINSVDFLENEMCHQAISLMNAIYTGDVSYEALTKRDAIFKQIEKKTEQHDRRGMPFKSIKKWIFGSVACVILFCTGISYGSYWYGYYMGNADLEQTNIVVKAPYGATTEVELPDKSLITLNAGSSLTYPSFFQKERVVTLIGEGLFDIEKSDIPFIVQTENLYVKVLGTRFNLRAYENEEQTQITLEKGLVEVYTDIQSNESLQLHPNQQLAFNRKTGELKRETVNTACFTAWQKGGLVFKDISLVSIAKSLERKFNVPIQIDDTELKNERYYVTFEHNESLESMLNLLSYKRKWSYKRDDGRVQITKQDKAID